ncbi:MAG: twitching motility protein PilT [Lachnospiraceae bacterium]|nr:twitching motility protein PilT [Lachnospiraceae bacterium]MDY6220973.1 twitching motility protein PilT [Candidatus Alectryocaccobium sp.]
MIQLITGEKGTGKTKLMLDGANEAIKTAAGNIVYIDKSSKHMYELSNKIRLIDASKLPLKNTDQFVGAICGIISQDHDLQQVYLDSFLKLAKIEETPELIEEIIDEFNIISETFNVDFIISASVEKSILSEKLQAISK